MLAEHPCKQGGPQPGHPPLHRLLQNSNLPNASQWNAQLEAPYINRATKLYLYYPQAWWIQGLNNGSLQYVDTEWPPVNVPVIGR